MRQIEGREEWGDLWVERKRERKTTGKREKGMYVTYRAGERLEERQREKEIIESKPRGKEKNQYLL